jgi:cysteine desulfurase
LTDQYIYLDYNATSPLRREARDAVWSYFETGAGNPSSAHAPGRAARKALVGARREIASLLGVERDSIVFTGNGSEANLLALLGTLGPRTDRPHVLATNIEHPSVRDLLRSEHAAGRIRLEELPVDRSGFLHTDQIVRALRPDTALVTVMTANNEIGTLQPIAEIAAVLADHPAVFHTDAVQALGKVAGFELDPRVDLASFSAHKWGGLPGLGILLRRPGRALGSPLSAGRQEFGLRGGTEDVAACVAAAAALCAALAEVDAESVRLGELREQLRAMLATRLPGVHFHTPEMHVLPGTLNFSIDGGRGAWLLARLDAEGIAVSHGSACSTLAPLPSHVIEALGEERLAASSLRVSMGRGSRSEHVDKLVTELQRVVRELR